MEEETNLNLKANIIGTLDYVISVLNEIKSDVENGEYEEDIPRLLKRSQIILNSLKIEDDDADGKHRKSYRLE
ncbi:MAG: hypothetical protein [Bacteriophage sp.]|nr:MAG: hypothetical protein [Bacteriophage sp.]